MKMCGAVESDEVYVTAGLKGRNNSGRIMGIGRKARRRGLRRRGSWREDKPAILVERGGGEDYIPSGDVESETVLWEARLKGLNNIHRLLLPQPKWGGI